MWHGDGVDQVFGRVNAGRGSGNDVDGRWASAEFSGGLIQYFGGNADSASRVNLIRNRCQTVVDGGIE
jgi:hypothetical protein